MAQRSHRPWFKTKKYGWGWTPASLEGWVVLIGALVLYLGAILIAALTASDPVVLVVTLVGSVLLTIVLVGVSMMTGEKPRWRWGGE